MNNKSKEFLRQAGECPYDHGGYFIIGGSEKVLITRQEQAFNTLYITPQKSDPKIKIFSSITCLNPKTRMVKRATISYTRRENTIHVGLPFVRKPIPLFVLFRALGFQTDREILQMIYPDFETPEAKLMLPKLRESVVDALPFTNTFTAIQYIKTLTKGYGEAHVIDILRNQLFIHMPNDPTSQALFLADCVRKILRVHEGFDTGTDRDDTRNQRCLTSGFLIQMLFSNAYNQWKKSFTLTIAREYEANRNVLYSRENFVRIFDQANVPRILAQGMITEAIMRGFKGKWDAGLGEEKAGVLQALSRLSYCDFISHCRRVILDFDTGMKLTGPRKLHPSQYGYFCTNETPGGASIGIAKNLNVLTGISTSSELPAFMTWLRTKGRVYSAEDLTVDQCATFVPVYMNNGLYGFTAKPQLLTAVLKTMKRCGCSDSGW
jgi:DNA-directed RNA polymerase II subunit RPB2